MNKKSYNLWLDFINNEKGKNLYHTTDADKRTTYTFIYDCINNSFTFMDSTFSAITGHKVKAITPGTYIDLIHPDDYEYFLEKEKQIQTFTNNLRFNDVFRYVFKYSYRLKKSDGSYIQVLQEYQAFEINEQGYWATSLVRHIITEGSSIISLNTDYQVYDKEKRIYLDLNNKLNLTSRELEIVELIKNGLTSKQISLELHISINTILTHRKNILSKTQSNSFIELFHKMTGITSQL
ncbi:PAS domain-containing protein [Myroides marinus]|uniref:LuxR C-terminal-related transcriptional regulator n=1 Tax=Myroides marinus TaxID=703342 RepID=UPI0025771269|nr:LuxR C-terminal-related transcriptional regulator [Myroides marinus]MDM1374964.1 PAS domain-containing protein [Myroides marinus]MDM1379061.1 PAS domain-containing protein [Myroides marinus]MDM1386332.1 PAS domain-containing protein [Myroides marinus]MDM1390403.1 PAS domain-containing protein [Myroides marinus]MDM1393598.1 PAS domain-containing protein [Myroides marinus]